MWIFTRHTGPVFRLYKEQLLAFEECRTHSATGVDIGDVEDSARESEHLREDNSGGAGGSEFESTVQKDGVEHDEPVQGGHPAEPDSPVGFGTV